MRIKKKTITFTFLGILIVILVLLAVRFPQIQSLIRSKSHFIEHPRESRVLYESGAWEMADQIAVFLAQAIEKVERSHYQGSGSGRF